MRQAVLYVTPIVRWTSLADTPLRDVVNMKVGDVIPLQVPELLQVEVDGAPVLEGHYGVQHGRYAIKVERFLSQDETTAALPGEQNG